MYNIIVIAVALTFFDGFFRLKNLKKGAKRHYYEIIALYNYTSFSTSCQGFLRGLEKFFHFRRKSLENRQISQSFKGFKAQNRRRRGGERR